jgi:hypothetical protein
VDAAGNGQVTCMEGLAAPLPRRTTALLRRAVREHAAAERRRTHPPVVHVGVPGSRVATLVLAPDEPTDPGLRTDLVAALRVRAGPTPDQLVWLTRSGELQLQDVDAWWLAAARAAYDEAQAPLVFVVVNRRGWRDPRSGLGQTWSRVRV